MRQRAALAAVLVGALSVGWSPVAAAEGHCQLDSEPNDTPDTAQELDGPRCVEGSLHEGDQDLALWEVTATDASTRWRLSVEGAPGVLTALKFYEVTSDADGAVLGIGRAHSLEVAVQPDDIGAARRDNVMLPVGRYVLAISRSESRTIDGPSELPYRYAIDRGPETPPSGDVEPNDSAGEGQPYADAFGVSGDLEGSVDNYVWQVGDVAGDHWAIELSVPLGRQAAMELRDTSGLIIDEVRTETTARALDLELAPGTYTIGVSPRADEPTPYILTTSHAPPAGDREPNDDTASAIPIAEGEPLLGRLAGRDDRDRYVLEVTQGEPALRDARLIWQSELERTLCLLHASDHDVVCRGGDGVVSISNLRLGPGRHTFEVRGVEDPDDQYVLRIDTTDLAEPDFEGEPNDDVTTATTLDPGLGMRGLGAEGDRDVFHLPVTGEPQLWQVDLIGESGQLEWVRPSGSVLGRGESREEGVVRLTDLYLVPGEHWFQVRADGRYELEATALGQPDPEGEREPNGDRVLAEAYRIGQRKVGRLPATADVDVYRFTLAAPGHVRLILAQPDDGAIDLHLHREDEPVAQVLDTAAGASIVWDLALLPGDHLLELRPSTVSEGRYELTSERLDPFRLAVDQEPNDDPAWARPVPASLSWDGDALWRGDEDRYRLPALTGPEPLRIMLSDPDASVRLVAGDTRIVPDQDEDGAFVTADVPVGVPLELAIVGSGPYHVDVSGGGLTPIAEPAPPPLEVSWELPDTPVAAYWDEAQRVEGGLRLTNTGAEGLDLSLDTATSHYLWRASLAESDVSLAPGESVIVPAVIDVAADAWAGEAVLVSARAVTATGAAASGSVELVAISGAAPTGTTASWSLPDELLGGLNAAYLAFGALPGGSVDPRQEPVLFDGVAPDGGGFVVQVDQMPLELDVDLAGNEAVPVAGIVLDPLAGDGRLSDTPSRFELLLSMDGVDWRPVLEGQLAPLPVDQPFVLEQPQDARFARLRILARYGGGTGSVGLGEWKVVAAPGVALSREPLDIADTMLGGHVVALRPSTGSPETGPRMLDAERRREALRLDDGPAFEVVVGFQDDRAALVERLEWLDPDGSRPATRLEEVDVWVSTETPLGPWIEVGTWSLARAAEGSVAPYEPEGPTWTRFVRLTGEAPLDAREVELPGSLRVIESAAGDDYRSVLGEWGAGSSRGPFERYATMDAVERVPSRDAADDPDGATPLALGVQVTDRAQIAVDEDWYVIDVPLGMTGLEIVVDGRPTVGVALSLIDPAGGERPVVVLRQPDGSVRYQARVEPGQRYRLRIHQPPFSAVFAFDTSPSMGPFLDVVLQGIRTFAAEVQPGREAVMVVPFAVPPLLPDWEDDAYLLQDAVNNMGVLSTSSDAEAGLLDAAKRLEEREGARAVLLVTDATGIPRRGREFWDALASARPIVFAVHIGASEQPIGPRQLMQDWAASGGGHYTYPTTHGAMQRAFDRMATWLRRPAVYSLRYEAVDLDPGSLTVLAPAKDGSPLGLAPGVGVEIVLDTSGSMLERLAGRRRIDVAKASLDQLVAEALPEGLPIALRAFGGRRDTRRSSCQTRLVHPLGPLDRAALRGTIDELRATRRTATPIAAALEQVGEDLAAVTGTRSIVLVTDGDETCDGDPAAAIAALREAGVDVTVNIVGFALEDEALKARMAEWADLGGGRYFDAAGADELVAALGAALGAPIRVYGPDGEVQEGGTVGGGPIGLDPGTYRVEVLSDPPVVFEEVTVAGGEAVVLELPAEG